MGDPSWGRGFLLAPSLPGNPELLVGYSYALSLTFAAAALRRYREKRYCSAQTLALGCLGD